MATTRPSTGCMATSAPMATSPPTARTACTGRAATTCCSAKVATTGSRPGRCRQRWSRPAGGGSANLVDFGSGEVNLAHFRRPAGAHAAGGARAGRDQPAAPRALASLPTGAAVGAGLWRELAGSASGAGRLRRRSVWRWRPACGTDALGRPGAGLGRRRAMAISRSTCCATTAVPGRCWAAVRPVVASVRPPAARGSHRWHSCRWHPGGGLDRDRDVRPVRRACRALRCQRQCRCRRLGGAGRFAGPGGPERYRPGRSGAPGADSGRPGGGMAG